MSDQELIDLDYKEGKKSFDYVLKDIMTSFNFRVLHQAMTAVNWTWNVGTDAKGNNVAVVPSVETLEQKAKELLKEVYDREVSISTGGFCAGIDGDEIYLTFSFDSASTNVNAIVF
jgi:hypothetical protein